MIWRFFCSVVLCLGCALPSSSSADYRDHASYRSVLDAHHIKVSGDGVVDVPYRDAMILFEQEDLLDVVQRSYERLLPEGESPEFVIQALASNQWTFVNKDAQTSVIEEIHRTVEPDGGIRVVYFSEGKRFFGKYRSVVEIDVTNEPEVDASRYDVVVYAYPHNSFMRFFARHLGTVEKFFRSKTDEITDLSVAICRDLSGKPPVSQN